MRSFIDLHLKPPEGIESLEAMLELASRLGFEGVGVVAGRTSSQTDRRSASARSLDVVGRVDLMPKDSWELTTLLRRLRRRYEVIAVECHSKSVARQAAKDACAETRVSCPDQCVEPIDPDCVRGCKAVERVCKKGAKGVERQCKKDCVRGTGRRACVRECRKLNNVALQGCSNQEILCLGGCAGITVP